MSDTCDLCGKDRGTYEGFVWYSMNGEETELCRSCMIKWNKTDGKKSLDIKYKGAEPTTKQWQKKCDMQQKAFDKWKKEVRI
jgi:hypothetical protein